MHALSFFRLTGPWPTDPVRAAQARGARLGRLAANAVQRCPYWRDLFNSLGLAPEALRSEADLLRLPVLSRDTLVDRLDAIRMEGLDPDRCRKEKTNGTTGEPLVLAASAAEMRFKHALWFSGYMRFGLRPWHRQAKFMMPASMPGGRRAIQRLGIFRRDYFSVTLPVDAKIDAIRSARPRALFAWGSVLNEIAARLEQRGETLDVPLVFSSSEFVQRAAVEASIRGRLFDVYGAMEHGPMAWPCLAGGGFHIDPRWSILEILDAQGCPAKRGRLVCTSLWRHSVPLLRYDVGDEGEWGDSPCGCGDRHPRLVMLHGRIGEFVQLSSGERLTSGVVCSFFRGRAGIRQYRIVQRSDHEFTLLMVLAAGIQPGVLDGIRSDLHRQYGDAARFEVRAVPELYHPTGWKLPTLLTLERLAAMRERGVEVERFIRFNAPATSLPTESTCGRLI